MNILFRHAILLQLEAAAPASLPPATLRQGLILAGHRDCDNLPRELAYLADKQLIVGQPSELAPADIRYRITADGLDYLEREGLA